MLAPPGPWSSPPRLCSYVKLGFFSHFLVALVPDWPSFPEPFRDFHFLAFSPSTPTCLFLFPPVKGNSSPPPPHLWFSLCFPHPVSFPPPPDEVNELLRHSRDLFSAPSTFVSYSSPVSLLLLPGYFFFSPSFGHLKGVLLLPLFFLFLKLSPR